MIKYIKNKCYGFEMKTAFNYITDLMLIEYKQLER